MNYSNVAVFFVLFALLICSIQSKSLNEQSDKTAVRDKRWTFNTWRLHGRRYLPNNLNMGKRSTAVAGDDYQDDGFQTEDDIAHAIHEHLSRFFRGYQRQ